MSPLRKPSAVDSIQRAADRPGGGKMHPATAAPAPDQPEGEKPVRITLNCPPELFRHLERWAGEAAQGIGEPRVGVQDALRAMVHVIAMGEAGEPAEVRVRAQLRSQLEQQRRKRSELRRGQAS